MTTNFRPSRKRHIADRHVLFRYNATPIAHNPSSGGDLETAGTLPLPTHKPTQRPDPTRKDDDDKIITGISIGQWNIHSQTSTIANEMEIEKLTHSIECLGNGQQMNHDSKDESCSNIQTSSIRRRLCIPEIVFPNACISLKYDDGSTSSHSKSGGPSTSGTFLEIKFNAYDALYEWASCHSHLTDLTEDHITPKDQPTTYTQQDESYRGVSIIQAIDAQLWEERKYMNHSYSTGADTSTHQSSKFAYDWTFSTPYVGSTITRHPTLYQSDIKGIDSPIWKEISQSGFDIPLLMDQSQPILYYDDIILFEDDMHDNGYVSLRSKIRIMPTCALLLSTLFIRVDHVLVRVREVRIFVKFGVQHPSQIDCMTKPIAHGDSENFESEVDRSTTPSVWRDVVWRECSWNDLNEYGLCTNVNSWRFEDEEQNDDGKRKQQAIQRWIKLLPQVDLPYDIPQHSYLKW